MINLNLLPPSKKTLLKRQKTLAKVQSLIIYTIIILFFALVFLRGNLYIIKEEIDSLETRIESANQISQSTQGLSLDQEISTFNSLIKNTYNYQNDFLKWSLVLDELADSVPQGISFSYLNLSKESLSVEIRGKANTRDNLVNFKNLLENNPNYSDINIPITSFLTKTDLDFKITFKFQEQNEES
ncbi:PilN domain-containing protein [Patescibacteria group bacterium]|nr:PilN domain-containing protein [Patescibacteria group bacterium]